MSASPDDVLAVIALGKRRGWRKWFGPGAVALLLAVGGGVVFWRVQAQPKSPFEYITMPAKRGDLRAIVTATGNLKGLDTVEVGAETNGKVKAVHVDFNDSVKTGQLLCEIDPLQLTAARDQAKAQLQAAEADLRNRKATAAEATLTAERSKSMIERGLISQAQLESDLAAAERAAAAVQSGVAQIVVARASLNNAQTALEKTWIRSPMDGVVLSRSVEVGQTVISAMQTPVLFVIARDLRRMELTVAVDEADIGQVKEGQTATFSVDAFSGRDFSATLRLIQNIATTTDNVVTYEARLTVDNEDLALRPGMTATVNILTAERQDALLIPNAALRFKPASTAGSRGGFPFFGPPPARPAEAPAPKGPVVWIVEADTPRAVPVVLGLSDGNYTEVTKGEIEPGQALITDMISRKQ